MKSLSVLLLCLVSYASLAQPQRVIQDQDLGSGQYNWSQDTCYILDGYVFLDPGGLLTIEAGTIIKAMQTPSTGDPTTALTISQGARIHADGSYIDPIIFTAESDDIADPVDLAQSDRGLWGGLVLLGDAPVTDSAGTSLTVNHPYFSADEPRGQYGGANPNHNSGILNNVSIRFAGANVITDHFAGLTLAGVGSLTNLDTVEVFASGSDGIRFIGGTVDSRHLASSFCADDAFEWDLGFTGRGQYWFSVQSEDQADCGIEGRGHFSKPVIYNLTLIGSGQNGSANNPVAIRFLDGSGGELGMSVFADFPNAGIEVEDLPGGNDCYAKIASGELVLRANVWSNFGRGNNFTSAGLIEASEGFDEQAQDLMDHLVDSNVIIDDYLVYLSRKQDMRLNPDYFTDGSFHEFPYFSYPEDSFFILAELICSDGGAFLTDGAWWLRYWTALDQDNYLMHPCAPTFIESFEFWGGDTVIMSCEELEDNNFQVSYRCFNSFCSLLNQTLAISMRMKRKKRRFDLTPLEYCYIQPLEIEGIESMAIYDSIGLIERFIVLDTFSVPLTILVIDTVAPTLTLTPCDTCNDGQFAVLIEDCDTAWITAFDTSLVNDTLVEYKWEGIDRCGNFADFRVTQNLNAPVKTWFQDLDGDGYGNDEVQLRFQGIPPGYSELGGDCDDSNPLKNPGMAEDPLDNYDNNCDGLGEYEVCAGSDQLSIEEDCNPVQINRNPSQFETNSTIATCIDPFVDFDGDLWLTLTAPSSGEVTIKFDPDVSADMNLYRGTCDDLELLDCAVFGNKEIFTNQLQPGELLHLQLIAWKGTQDVFSICATAPNTTSNKHQDGNIQNLIVYPNPTNGTQTVEWENARETTGSLNVYNTLGKAVLNIFQNVDLVPGTHQRQLNLSGLAPGQYWMILQSDHRRHAVKTVKF